MICILHTDDIFLLSVTLIVKVMFRNSLKFSKCVQAHMAQQLDPSLMVSYVVIPTCDLHRGERST